MRGLKSVLGLGQRSSSYLMYLGDFRTTLLGNKNIAASLYSKTEFHLPEVLTKLLNMIHALVVQG